jgi:hypothetical protein
MTYSHIFKARKESGYKFVLYITATPALRGAPIESGYVDSKVAAKKYAAAKNAKAWTYSPGPARRAAWPQHQLNYTKVNHGNSNI